MLMRPIPTNSIKSMEIPTMITMADMATTMVSGNYSHYTMYDLT